MTNAPATAWTTRAMIRIHTDGATADMTAERTKSATPSLKMRTRPCRSAIRPASGRNAAVPIRYPDDTKAVVVSAMSGNEAVMSSNAIFVAVVLNPTNT